MHNVRYIDFSRLTLYIHVATIVIACLCFLTLSDDFVTSQTESILY